MLENVKTEINYYENLPNDYSIEVTDTDLRKFPKVTTTVVVNGGGGLSEDNFIVTTSRKNGKIAKNKVISVEPLGGDTYGVTYTVSSPKDLTSECIANILVQDGTEGGSITGIKFGMKELVDSMYYDFAMACYNCQFNNQYALINSGVILTSYKAFNEKKNGAYTHIAGQSQATIDAGNLGSNVSNDSYEVDGIKVLSFGKAGNGLSVVGYNVKTITQYKEFEKLKPEAQERIRNDLDYEPESYEECYQKRLISNFETLGLVKDDEGMWKFSTAKYEITSKAYPNLSVNQVLDAGLNY